MKNRLMTAAAALFIFATPVFAEDTAKANIEAMSKITTAKDFVSHAARSDMFEIKSGEMAQQVESSAQTQ